MSTQTLTASLLGQTNGRSRPEADGHNAQSKHGVATASSDAGDSSPPRGISYEGMVSVLAASAASSSPPGSRPRHADLSGEVSTTADEDSSPPSQSYEASKRAFLEQMEARRYSSFEARSPPSSEPNVDSEDCPDDMIEARRAAGMRLNYPSSSSDGREPDNALMRLREICEKGVDEGASLIRTTKSMAFKDHSIDRGVLQEDGQTLFQCHLCTYTSFARDEFNEHMNNHYEFMCPKCDFDTKDEQLWRDHLRDDHQCTPEDLEDDQGVKVPRVNSQGKVKTFKCKKCEFVSVTKEEFWKHSRQHIKPGKMLNCPKCIFVTEYKHHLEYHLRNHFGAKPLKCPHCNYTCVNKSMLNSHMKSHIKVYMYRCADCNYATKYCHSLKLHLRKYAHKPDVVLNSDGTPNPLPIIDIYGTRRGPKRKPEESGGITHLEDCHYINNNRNRVKARQGAGKGGKKRGEKNQQPRSPRSSGSSASHKPSLSSKNRERDSQAKDKSSSKSQGAAAPLPPTQENPGGGYLPSPYMMAQMQHLQKLASRMGVPPGLMGSPGAPGPGMPPEDQHGGAQEPQQPPATPPMLKCSICNFETGSREIYSNHMMFHAAKDSPPPPMLIPIESNMEAPSQRIRSSSREAENHEPSRTHMSSPSTSSEYLEYFRKLGPLLKQQQGQELAQGGGSHGGTSSSSPSGISSTTFLPSTADPQLFSRMYLENMMKMKALQGHPDQQHMVSSVPSALDLSNSEVVSRPPQAESSGSNGSGGNEGGVSSTKSRRKGKAYKIERKDTPEAGGRDKNGDNSSTGSGTMSDVDVDAKSDEVCPTNGSQGSRVDGNSQDESHHQLPEGATLLEGQSDEQKPQQQLNGSHICKYCQIAFMDPIMYTIHMGYHGFSDPFKCNICGEESGDKVSFYLHIARNPHQ